VSKVYFVGCGPGDPELITVKAKKLVQKADIIVYSGSLIPPERAELPESIKVQFRPCAMIKADFVLIAENMLMSEGFKEAKVLSSRFVTL
jgi:precorrin-4/cobalt-precorrin-4 C11-methyltransferase